MSDQFPSGSRLPDRIAGEARFAITNTSGLPDYLTLAVLSYTTGKPNSYVGMGYWQLDKPGTSSIQNVEFSTFTYGFDTPAAAVPHTGFASWDTDIFGLYSRPGEATRTMEGSGRFDIDFSNSVFRISGDLSDHNVVGNSGSVDIAIIGDGSITSDGHISGLVGYEGAWGSITGGFYGPNAEELGASFLAFNDVGSVLNGAMTGIRNTQTAPAVNMTLLNLQVDQDFEALGAAGTVLVGTAAPGTPVSGVWSTPIAGLAVTPAGPSRIDLTISGITNLTLDPVQPRANFLRYTGQSPTVSSVQVDFFQPGPANTQLALTYTSFATWRWTTYDAPGGGTPSIYDTTFFLLYGIKPAASMGAMTGTASYNGVVYGIGSTREGPRYDLSGTSTFLVDFSARTYSGSLQITGTDALGADHDFGSYAFANTLTAAGAMNPAYLKSDPNWDQLIRPAFYGPQGQEIGANFNLGIGAGGAPGTIYLDGITLAKQHP